MKYLTSKGIVHWDRLQETACELMAELNWSGKIGWLGVGWIKQCHKVYLLSSSTKELKLERNVLISELLLFLSQCFN